ncbi:hypothetical protein KP509_10G076000 [Ceratopteris richardii]|uniref:peptidylprolyl isomerase n=1 Tax=Ceratopteris richardii TaxID=49495 RepID=A0A8T2U2T9_CERRI|nr:hypothetical protein KP509_10G076000 [Ceratopteris richardii]
MSASMSLSLCSSIHGAAAGKKLVSFCGFSMEKTPEDGQRKRKQMMKAVLCCRISDHLISKRSLLLSLVGPAPLFIANPPAFSAERPQFRELEGSGGLKAIDIREGSGRVPQAGDKVAIHYYARLAAKQGWRFDSTYDHKDNMGAPEPFVFVVGSGTVR